MSTQKEELKEIHIAIMGLTGAGKSTIIKELTGDSRIVIGHTLDAQTQQIESYTFKLDEKVNVTLYDTPGFDDSGKGNFKTDADVLRYLATYFCDFYAQGKKLKGKKTRS